MKIKPGENLPQNDFFYLDEKNEVKKIATNDLFKKQKAIIFIFMICYHEILISYATIYFVNSFYLFKYWNVINYFLY